MIRGMLARGFMVSGQLYVMAVHDEAAHRVDACGLGARRYSGRGRRCKKAADWPRRLGISMPGRGLAGFRAAGVARGGS